MFRIANHGALNARSRAQILSSSILLVEDDDVQRTLVTHYLRASGFKNVDIAPDGETALAMIRAQMPDIVILDMMLPKMSGFDVCRALRADADYADLPILVQTGLDAVDQRVEIIRCGATDLLIKPINSLELVARVGLLIEKGLLIRDLRESNDRIKHELRSAREMQLELLPSDKEKRALIQNGLDTDSMFIPSQELGGDLWGTIHSTSDRQTIYIADFAGHGVRAALNTFRLHTLIQELGAALVDPGEILSHLNTSLKTLLSPRHFATATCVTFDLAGNTLRYAAAGSPSPVLFSAAGAPHLLDSCGVPLGVELSSRYVTRTAAFEPGALLFLYSDALSEMSLSDGEQLGEEGVLDVSAQAGRTTAENFLRDTMDRFHARLVGDWNDDMTAVALRHGERRTAGFH